MRLIPTRVHALLDFALAIVLVAAPWVLQFDHGSAETWLPLAIALTILVTTMFTDHEWGVSRSIPMPAHLVIDIIAGLLLAVSPWLFGFAPTVWAPHLVLGATEVVVALLTQKQATELSYPGVKR